jgi:hypothetical protein
VKSAELGAPIATRDARHTTHGEWHMTQKRPSEYNKSGQKWTLTVFITGKSPGKQRNKFFGGKKTWIGITS